MTLPRGITRSLGPTYTVDFSTDSIPVRIVILPVWQVYILTLYFGSVSK